MPADAEPEITSEADLLPWAMAHRAKILTLWDQQYRHNSTCVKEAARMEERLRCVEKKAAQFTIVASILGGGVGSAVALLMRSVFIGG